MIGGIKAGVQRGSSSERDHPTLRRGLELSPQPPCSGQRDPTDFPGAFQAGDFGMSQVPACRSRSPLDEKESDDHPD